MNEKIAVLMLRRLMKIQVVHQLILVLKMIDLYTVLKCKQ